jgi:uncharacterized protein (DUF1778 family)
MNKTNVEQKRERLSIDVLPEEHKKIKAYAAIYGETIREFILKSLRERLQREAEERSLADLTMHLDTDPVLNEIWNNDKDKDYDKL